MLFEAKTEMEELVAVALEPESSYIVSGLVKLND